jgi:hypothetical protein
MSRVILIYVHHEMEPYYHVKQWTLAARWIYNPTKLSRSESEKRADDINKHTPYVENAIAFHCEECSKREDGCMK